MTGILPMAALTLLLGAIAAAAYLASGQKGRRFWPLLLLGLPLSYLINTLVKGPLIRAVMGWTGITGALNSESPLWFAALLLFNAPVFEEIVKLTPFLIPGVRRLLAQPFSAAWAGLALGMSFGLGEAAYIAYGVARAPQYQSMAWYLFTGYLFERLAVILLHGWMTGIATWGLAAGWKKAAGGLLTAMGLHALANSGIILNATGWITPVWVQAPLFLAIVLAMLLFERLRRKAMQDASSPQPEEKVYF